MSYGEKLSIAGQIEHMKKRGIAFEIYRNYVESKGLLKYQAKELREIFFRRFDENCDYYKTSEPILTTFTFFKKVVDNWYPEGV